MCVCVSVSRTEGFKRLNLGHSETTPLWGILTAGRLAYWCPICMAPCPAQGIGLFPFPSSLPPALHLERLLPSSSTAFFSSADNREAYLGHLAGSAYWRGWRTRAAKGLCMVSTSICARPLGLCRCKFTLGVLGRDRTRVSVW